MFLATCYRRAPLPLFPSLYAENSLDYCAYRLSIDALSDAARLLLRVQLSPSAHEHSAPNAEVAFVPPLQSVPLPHWRPTSDPQHPASTQVLSFPISSNV